MPRFERYIGIDYSGAKTANSRLAGLRVYRAEGDSGTEEIRPPDGRHWTRRGIAQWLPSQMEVPTLVGIDHAFSLPLDYFERYGLGNTWHDFLEDFQKYWQTDIDGIWVRDCMYHTGSARKGEADWFRLTEKRAKSEGFQPKPTLYLKALPGTVAFSTHAGLPWLLYLRRRLGNRVWFWPFDGWSPAAGKSVIVEVYPRLWSRGFQKEARSNDQHDAYSVARWLKEADETGRFPKLFELRLNADEKARTRVEGWILGIGEDDKAIAEHAGA